MTTKARRTVTTGAVAILLASIAHAGILTKTASQTPLSPYSTTILYLCDAKGNNCTSGKSYLAGNVHTGLDLTNAYSLHTTGARVVSILPGVVLSVVSDVTCQGCATSPGNRAIIRYVTNTGEVWNGIYLHFQWEPNNGQAGGLIAGERVARGQLLGYKGQTGFAFGAHVHLELSNGTSPALIEECAVHFQLPCSLGKRLVPVTSSTRLTDPLPYVNGQRRALIPFFSFSYANAVPSATKYDVYGIATAPLFAAISLTPSTPRTFTNVGVGGVSGTGAVSDVFLTASTTLRSTSLPLCGSRMFACSDANGCDFKFYGYSSEMGQAYPVKVAILPNAASEVIDNDQLNADSASCTLAAKPGAYVGCEGSAPEFSGYFLTAKLFPSGQAGYFARWFPSKAGKYRVYVHIPTQVPSAATAVTYKIYPSGPGTTAKVSSPITHRFTGTTMGYWQQLKVGTETTWQFQSGGYVGLSVETLPSGSSVAVDAVKFIAAN
jgi:hypothetical protein